MPIYLSRGSSRFKPTLIVVVAAAAAVAAAIPQDILLVLRHLILRCQPSLHPLPHLCGGIPLDVVVGRTELAVNFPGLLSGSCPAFPGVLPYG